MTALACSFEMGAAGLYTMQGYTFPNAGLSVTYRHKTLAGVGGDYSGQAYYGTMMFPSMGVTTERWLNFWLYPQGSGAATARFYRSGAVQASCWVGAQSSIWRGDFATLLATAPLAMSWGVKAHWINVQLLAQDANGLFEVWIDGVRRVYLDPPGDTQALATADWDQFSMATDGLNVFNVDDAFTTTAAEGRPTEMITQVVVPNANVSVTFAPSAGANWQCVNTVPFVTSPFNQTVVAGNEDVYGVAPPTAAFGYVQFLSVYAYVARDGTITQARIGVSSAAGGATAYMPYTALAAAGSWSIIQKIQTIDPFTGVAWTSAGLDDAQLHIQFN